jgi:protein SCO1/2
MAAKRSSIISFVLFPLLLTSHACLAETDYNAVVSKAKEAEGKDIGDFVFFDQDGVEFNIKDYDKPLVIGYAFTRCPHTCSPIVASLKNEAQRAKEALGSTFSVLVVGFDPDGDNAKNLKEFGSRFTDDFTFLRFASSDGSTIKNFTERTGFFYKKTEDGLFDHADMATVVDAEGRIYRQIFGVRGGVADALVELVKGAPSRAGNVSFMERLKYFCYTYDPDSGEYRLNYAIAAGMALQFFAIAATVWFVWGRSVGRKKYGDG